MNSQMMDEVFMGPIAARGSAQTFNTPQTAFKLTVATNMVRAVKLGAFSSTTSLINYALAATSGDTILDQTISTFGQPPGPVSSADTQFVMQLLNQAGYRTQVIGTNLVITW